MIYYMVGGFEELQNAQAEEAMARMFLRYHSIYPRLVSFAYPNHVMSVLALKKKADISGKVRIMLDSGAYSAKTLDRIKIDIDQYIEFFFAHMHLIEGFINLDIIPNGEASFKNYMYMRNKGLEPIPVHHSRSPLKFLEYYIAQTDYIAISLDNNLSKSGRIRNLNFLWDQYLIDAAGLPLLKVHGLGISSTEIKCG